MPDWDATYAQAPAGLFGSEPNEYLREIMARSDVRLRTALCLADGDGRNSRFLAALGVRVTAVDLSSVAVANGQALDALAGLTVERFAADLDTWRPPAGRTWDAVFLMYLQAPWPTRRAALAAGWSALAAGGWMVLEGFADTPQPSTLGPGKSELLYRLDMTLAELPDHDIVEALTGRVRLSEGPRHRGLADVIRLAVRKPLQANSTA
ncbi:MAG: class I SAM-dependent methyltransferase [Hyphomicrobiaceae bacterium]|nr:class I SAM-dependent methyltransferase [Hyphomicrobiaceae bacterium]